MFDISLRRVYHEQKTLSWLKWRMEGVGASDIAVIAGVCKEKTPYQLYQEKKGYVEPEDLSRNPHVRRGNRCEPIVREYMINELGVPIEVFCAEDSNHPHRKVSFDGVAVYLSKGEAIPVEIKCPCPSRFNEVLEHYDPNDQEKVLSSELVQYHLWQMQYQIAMVGSRYGLLVFYCEHSNRIVVIKIQANLAIQQKAIELVDQFAEALATDNPPDMDPDRDVFVLDESTKSDWEEAATQLWLLSDEESKLKAKLEELQRKKDTYCKVLYDISRGFRTVNAGGVQVTRFPRKGRLNYTALLNDHNIQLNDEMRAKYSGESTIGYRVSFKNKGLLTQQSNQLVVKDYCSTWDEVNRAIALTL
ncbi:YqaJ viral recombinase family protein [Vibrio sp. Y2-5]|uniref:lambda-exonuclease family protein n=1 Tax=Vibrio sp. Y2-5 TaxID=2743977 RepID=UPI0016609E6B|nr:YqaJ viral recombinase family protein [Vibrio sp. Y2-5]MBD0788044.1 YqaJ viral recombinase family protein [Vibrio sp. Y2-5]